MTHTNFQGSMQKKQKEDKWDTVKLYKRVFYGAKLLSHKETIKEFKMMSAVHLYLTAIYHQNEI